MVFSYTVSAEQSGTLQILSIIGILFGILALAYTYQRTQTLQGLDAQILKNKRIILKQRNEIRENEDRIAQQKNELVESIEDKVRADDVKKHLEDPELHGEGLRREFWDKVETIASEPGKSELDKLLDQKKEVEEMIELTKAKYHTRVIDEASFNDITKDYQKKLIEIESKMRKIEEAKGDV
jgi:hypothetical protein